MDEVFRDGLKAGGSGDKEAIGSDAIDEPEDASGVVMDEDLGVFVEEVFMGIDGLEPGVDVAEGFILRHSSDVVSDADPVEEVEVGGSLEGVEEGVLAGEEDLDRGPVFEDRGDEEPQVSETVRGDEVGVVDEEDEGLLGVLGPIEDLEEQALLASGRGIFAEGGEHELEQGGCPEVGDVDIDREELGWAEATLEEPEDGGFSEACGPGEQSDFAVLREELKTSEGL
jgi:hypothetical protein